jgi:hypothetical protein
MSLTDDFLAGCYRTPRRLPDGPDLMVNASGGEADFREGSGIVA